MAEKLDGRPWLGRSIRQRPIRRSRMECPGPYAQQLVGALIPHPVNGMGDESAFYIRRKDSTTWRLW